MKITKFASKGFSLVEMLVVIAIIGIIAAVAVPQISDFTSSAEDSRNKRNAQNLASAYSSAQAAGLDLIAGHTSKASAVDLVVTGKKITGGVFDGKYFGVPNMDSAAKTAALDFLKLTADGMLEYVAEGGQE